MSLAALGLTMSDRIEHTSESDGIMQCRYMAAAYPSLTGDESCSEHEHNAPTFALARALTEAIQEAEPTDEQIGWALDDAAAIIGDFDPAPLTWTVTKPQISRETGIDFTFEVNGIDYIVQPSGDGEIQHPISREEFDSWFEDDDGWDDEDEDCQHEWELRSEHDLWVCAWCSAEVTSPPGQQSTP